MSKPERLAYGLTLGGCAVGYMIGRLWGAFFVLAVGLCFIMSAHLDKKMKSREGLKRFLVFLPLILFGCIAGAHESVQFWPKPQFAVYTEFIPIHRVHPELGDAVADVVADGTYEARHEHATVLWSKRFGG